MENNINMVSQQPDESGQTTATYARRESDDQVKTPKKVKSRKKVKSYEKIESHAGAQSDEKKETSHSFFKRFQEYASSHGHVTVFNQGLRRASSLTALEDISTTVHREQHRQHHARSSVRHRGSHIPEQKGYQLTSNESLPSYNSELENGQKEDKFSDLKQNNNLLTNIKESNSENPLYKDIVRIEECNALDERNMPISVVAMRQQHAVGSTKSAVARSNSSSSKLGNNGINANGVKGKRQVKQLINTKQPEASLGNGNEDEETSQNGNSSTSLSKLSYSKMKHGFDLFSKSNIPRSQSLMELNGNHNINTEPINKIEHKPENSNIDEHCRSNSLHRTKDNYAALKNNFKRGSRERSSEYGTSSQRRPADKTKDSSDFQRGRVGRMSERGTSTSYSDNGTNRRSSSMYSATRESHASLRRKKLKDQQSSDSHSPENEKKQVSSFDIMRQYDIMRRRNHSSESDNSRLSLQSNGHFTNSICGENDDNRYVKKERVKSAEYARQSLGGIDSQENDPPKFQHRPTGKRALPQLPQSSDVTDVEERRKRISAAALERVHRGLHALRNEVKQELDYAHSIDELQNHNESKSDSNGNTPSDSNDKYTGLDRKSSSPMYKRSSSNEKLSENEVCNDIPNEKSFHKNHDNNGFVSTNDWNGSTNNMRKANTKITNSKVIEQLDNYDKSDTHKNSNRWASIDNHVDNDIRVIELESGSNSSDHGLGSVHSIDNDNQSKKQNEQVYQFSDQFYNGNANIVKPVVTGTLVSNQNIPENVDRREDMSKDAIQRLIHDLRDAASKPIPEPSDSNSRSGSNSGGSTARSSLSSRGKMLTPSQSNIAANNIQLKDTVLVNQEINNNFSQKLIKERVIIKPESQNFNHIVSRNSELICGKINKENLSQVSNELTSQSHNKSPHFSSKQSQRPPLHKIVQTCDLVSVSLTDIKDYDSFKTKFTLHEAPYYEGESARGDTYIIRPPVGRRQTIGTTSSAFASVWSFSPPAVTKSKSPVSSSSSNLSLVAIEFVNDIGSVSSMPRNQRICDGDFIIEVNDQYVVPMTVQAIETLLETSLSGTLHLAVARPKTHTSDNGKGDIDHKKEYEKMRFKFDSIKEEVDRNLDLIADLRCSIQERDSHIEYMEEKFKNSHSYCSGIEREIKEKDGKVMEWMLEVNKRDMELARLKVEMKQKEDKMEQLRKLLIQQTEVMQLQGINGYSHEFDIEVDGEKVSAV